MAQIDSSYFDVAEPLDHATFLSICDEVLRDSLLVLAPFGIPRCVTCVRVIFCAPVVFDHG